MTIAGTSRSIRRRAATVGCEETCAALHLVGLDPVAVTKVLGFRPTRSRVAGEVMVNSLGREHRAPKSVWCLSSEGSVPSRDFGDHLDWLITQLGPGAADIAHWVESDEVSATVRCRWWANLPSGGPMLSVAHLRALASWRVRLVFDVAFYLEDDDNRS